MISLFNRKLYTSLKLIHFFMILRHLLTQNGKILILKIDTYSHVMPVTVSTINSVKFLVIIYVQRKNVNVNFANNKLDFITYSSAPTKTAQHFLKQLNEEIEICVNTMS